MNGDATPTPPSDMVEEFQLVGRILLELSLRQNDFQNGFHIAKTRSRS